MNRLSITQDIKKKKKSAKRCENKKKILVAGRLYKGCEIFMCQEIFSL
jgi:hypothetical protein